MTTTEPDMTPERPSWLTDAHWPFGVRTCRTPAGDIAYTDVGSGPTLLLVHVGFWSIVWRDLITHLAGDFRCVTLDAPGTGLTGGPADVDLRRAADAIDGIVTTLDLCDLTLVMHDLGGPAGLEAAARWPMRVSRIAALNTFGWQPRGVAFVGMLRIMGSAPLRILDTFTGLLPRASATRMGVGRHLDGPSRGAFRRGVPRAGRASFHRYMRSALRHDYRQIDALAATLADRPLLTIFGSRNDPLGFQAIWRARFTDVHQVKVPRGNHFPMCDDPALVARELAAWHQRTSNRL